MDKQAGSHPLCVDYGDVQLGTCLESLIGATLSVRCFLLSCSDGQ
jgi:hypothetical protein